ncbi:MAG: nonstructural protein [Arizlama microvirus]|nr:MAG: nonstructural protein [Arizlama microvirus]
MKLKVFSVYDSKVEAYKQPFFMSTKGEAVRGILEVLDRQDHPFAKYPADFTLFELGEYDDANGKMLPLPTPISHGSLVEYQAKKTNHQIPPQLAL